MVEPWRPKLTLKERSVLSFPTTKVHARSTEETSREESNVENRRTTNPLGGTSQLCFRV